MSLRNLGDQGERTSTRFIVLLWLLFVIAISMMPLKFKYRAGTMGTFHNPGHFLIFFITSLLLCKPVAGMQRRAVRLLAACVFAAGSEVLEMLVYHNPLEWHDILVDTSGAFLGFAVATAWSAWMGRPAAQQNV